MAQIIRTCKERERLVRRRFSAGYIRVGLVLMFAGVSTAVAWHIVPWRGDASQFKSEDLDNVVGNYLAAQHARTKHEEDAAASFLVSALKVSPDDPTLYGRAITATVLSDQVAKGIRLSEKLLRLEPDDPLALFTVAVGHLHDGQPSQAEPLLERLPPSSLLGVAAQLMRAWILNAKHDTDGASEALAQLQSLPAVADLAYLHSAWMLDAAGAPREAAEKLQAIVANQPEPWYRLTELANSIYMRAGEPKAAAELTQRYVATHGFDAPQIASTQGSNAKARLTSIRDGAAEALFDLASLASRQNQREQALALGLLGLYLKPDFPALQLVVAELMESVDRPADAYEVYQSIDQTAPLAWTARLAAARNLDALDRFAESEAMLRAMAKERSDAPEPLIQLGDEFRRQDRFVEAVQVYDQAAERIGQLDQRHWRLLYARGIALERTKEWDRAEADFLKALELEADQPFVLNYLGYSWVEQGKHLDRAQDMIDRAVELRPNDGYIVDSLGWVLYRRGRYDDAVEKLERAAELKPEDPVINDHLGDAYWAVGRQREARFQWRASLVRDPEPELRASIERKLSEGLVREARAVQP